MKKFEEELKNGPVMIDKDNVTGTSIYDEGTLIGYFKDWISPEEHQAEIAKLNSKIDWLHGLLDERNEEVLQTVKLLNEAQPEIPEVPQFVADWLDKKPLYAINGSIPVEIIEWSQKQTGYADIGMNISHLLKLKVNGYTITKEKRFYLKNKLTGLYLYESKKGFFEQERLALELTSRCDYTQQEIDSMETGSYEQIEVEE